MTAEEATEHLVRAQRFLEAQAFEEAREAVRAGFQAAPEDPQVRDVYKQIHMADGIRRNRRARDLRRDEIRSTRKGDRAGYVDTPRVRQAFEAAVASLDRVLEVDPENAKVLMLKAGVLDRMDRRGNRERVVALFERALALAPGNEEIGYARDRVLVPCRSCRDTGFCPDCRGAGEVAALLLRSVCPTCSGQGICFRCGLF